MQTSGTDPITPGFGGERATSRIDGGARTDSANASDDASSDGGSGDSGPDGSGEAGPPDITEGCPDDGLYHGPSCPPPSEYACGDGAPECLTLCDDLCETGAACGYTQPQCADDCRAKLRCPGETPGMDIVICQGYRESIQKPSEVCGTLEHVLYDQPPGPVDFCEVLAQGASFQRRGLQPLCADPVAPCDDVLAFDGAGAFSHSIGTVEQMGTYSCNGDQVATLSGVSAVSWTYHSDTWTLTMDGVDGTPLTLTVPGFSP